MISPACDQHRYQAGDSDDDRSSLCFAGGAGAITDYFLYVTAVQDANCNAGAVAYASACLFDVRTNRPSLGAVNFCPNSFLNSDMGATLPVLVHELVHALVSIREQAGQLEMMPCTCCLLASAATLVTASAQRVMHRMRSVVTSTSSCRSTRELGCKPIIMCAEPCWCLCYCRSLRLGAASLVLMSS